MSIIVDDWDMKHLDDWLDDKAETFYEDDDAYDHQVDVDRAELERMWGE